jgi:hypothetical protein
MKLQHVLEEIKEIFSETVINHKAMHGEVDMQKLDNLASDHLKMCAFCVQPLCSTSSEVDGRRKKYSKLRRNEKARKIIILCLSCRSNDSLSAALLSSSPSAPKCRQRSSLCKFCFFCCDSGGGKLHSL